jgi:hypothetical protein
VNEYTLLETIGRGAFSKVKRVKRQNFVEEDLACKIVNKNSLVRQRAVRYSSSGEPIMLNNLDKVKVEYIFDKRSMKKLMFG